MRQSKNTGRWLIFSGTFLLVLVNLALLAVAHDIIDLIYTPYYETVVWGKKSHYPEWQRYFYWGTALADVLGKLLAGIGLIMEGRNITKLMRARHLATFQQQTTPPVN